MALSTPSSKTFDISEAEEKADAINSKFAEATTLTEALKEPFKSEAKRYLHDIRNLQSTVTYMLMRLRDESTLSEDIEYTTGVNAWIIYQERLINKLIETMRGSSATITSIESIELQSRLTLLTTMISVLIKEEKEGTVKFQTHFELPKEPTFLKLNWLALERIIMNLIGNAIKFTKEGFIRLSIKVILKPETQEAHLDLSVRDTGIGMKAEECSRIFQEGVQANSSIKATYGGTGIGLTYCKDAVISMGGSSIAVKSKKQLDGEDSGNATHIEEDTERVTRIEEPDWGTKFSFSINCQYSKTLATGAAAKYITATTATTFEASTSADTPGSMPRKETTPISIPPANGTSIPLATAAGVINRTDATPPPPPTRPSSSQKERECCIVS